MSTVTSLGMNIFVKNNASREIKSIGDDVEGLDQKVSNVGENFVTVGANLTKYVTLPLLAVATAGVKSAASFETSMSKLSANAGVAKEQVKEWEPEVRRLSRTYGVFGADAADALFFIASAGFEGADAMDVLELSLKGTAANLGETQDIANLVGKAVASYGEENITAARTLDILTAASANSVFSSEEMSGALIKVIPLAAEMGIELDEAAGIMAVLSQSTETAGQASTRFEGVMRAMLKPSAQASQMLEDVGSSSKELHAIIEEDGLYEAMLFLNEAFEGDIEAMGRFLGSSEALAGALGLLGVDAETVEGILKDVEDSVGDLDAAFEIASETAEHQFQKALVNMNDLLIEIGSKLLPKVVDGFELFNDALNDFIEFWQDLSPETKNFIYTMLGILAALGPILYIIGKVILAIKGLGAMLALVATPIGWVVLAIGLLVTAIVWVWTQSEAFRDLLTRVWNKIKDVALDVWGEIKDELIYIWGKIQDAADYIFGEAIPNAWEGIEDMVENAKPIWEGFVQFLTGPFLSLVKSWWGELKPIFLELKEKFVEWWEPEGRRLFEAALKFMGGTFLVSVLVIIGALILGFLMWAGFVMTAIDIIVKGLYWGLKIYEWIKEKWNAATAAVVQHFIDEWGKLKAFWDWLVDRIVSRWEGAKRVLTESIGKFLRGIATAWAAGVKAVGELWDKIRNMTAVPVNWVISNVYNAGIRPLWNAVANAVGANTISKLDGIKTAARGTVIPGYNASKSDDAGLWALRRGEAVVVPEAVQALGADFFNTLNAAGNKGINAVRKLMGGSDQRPQLPKLPGGAEDQTAWQDGMFTGMFPGMARGGIVGAVGSFKSKMDNFFEGGFMKAVDVAFKPIIDAVAGRYGRSGIRGLTTTKMVEGAITKIKGKMAEWAELLEGGDSGAFIAKAKSYLGVSGRPNKFSRAMNMPFGPWCGAFLSQVAKEVGATAAIGGLTPTNGGAGVPSYIAKMKKGNKNNPKPGDLLTYRGAGHINAYIGAGKTIGGNESDAVRIQNGYWRSATGLLKPDWGAAGGGMGGIGGGAQRWSGMVSRVLRMLGLSQSHLPNVLRAIAKESGGNPRAINNWDSNARMGDPSRGLLQTIGSTFRAYAGPLRGRGIYDPLANIYAAINYARSRYGSGWSARMARPGGYEAGTDFVPADGMYALHRGEQVVPAENSGYTGSRQPVTLEFHFSGPVTDRKQVKQMVLDGIRELEHAGQIGKVTR